MDKKQRRARRLNKPIRMTKADKETYGIKGQRPIMRYKRVTGYTPKGDTVALMRNLKRVFNI